ncbi:MAG: PIN domain-containing protein, partial [Tepidisphaeraceae bacterium]
VLSEFARVAVERLHLPAATVLRQLLYFERLDVVPVTADVLHRGIELQQLQKLAFWDSLILAAAERGGCAVLLSEDLSDGQLYGPVRATNPFRP